MRRDINRQHPHKDVLSSRFKFKLFNVAGLSPMNCKAVPQFGTCSCTFVSKQFDGSHKDGGGVAFRQVLECQSAAGRSHQARMMIK